MAKANFGDLKVAFLAALENRPLSDAYAAWVSLGRTVPASANKHLLANPTLALDQPSQVEPVLNWARWYATRPLHENEALSPSESYRLAMDLGTYALAGIAREAGEGELSAALLARARSSIAYLLLGAGVAAAREVRDHGQPGRAMVVVGDGRPLPVKGSTALPYIAQAGKRGHVRADLRDVGESVEGGSSFAGNWQYTAARALSVLVAQALGLRYDGRGMHEWEFRCFSAIRKRWPSLPPWGFAGVEADAARAYLRDPTDADLAYQIHQLADNFQPALPFDFVRYLDGSIFVVALELDESSTGGVAINAQTADGKTYRASADTGGRAKDDVRRQRVHEAPGGFECFWVDSPGQTLRVLKPAGVAEAWRARVRPGGNSFSVGGRDPLDDTQPLPPTDIPGNPAIPLPAEPVRNRSLGVNIRSLSPLECLEVDSPLGSWLLSVDQPAEVKPIWESEGWPSRWVVEAKP